MLSVFLKICIGHKKRWEKESVLYFRVYPFFIKISSRAAIVTLSMISIMPLYTIFPIRY